MFKNDQTPALGTSLTDDRQTDGHNVHLFEFLHDVRHSTKGDLVKIDTY